MARKISSLLVGDKIKFGTHYDATIVWLVVAKNHVDYPDNCITLMSEQILRLMCFDGKEADSTHSSRRSSGNGDYKNSNIRQWLNSTGAAGTWYSAQHSTDAPPIKANTVTNAYDGAAGFLTGFSGDEQEVLVDTGLTYPKSSLDGGGVGTCTDKVFVFSSTEIFSNLAGDSESQLAYFVGAPAAQATVTASCIEQAERIDKLTAGAVGRWWMRDVISSDMPGISNYSGFLGKGVPSESIFGVRPGCNITGDTLVTDTVDGDGCYGILYGTAPTTPQSINVPTTVRGDESLTVGWGSSTDVDNDLAGYILERQYNGGAWVQLYRGSNQTFTDAIVFGWESVAYRVRAFDSGDLMSAYQTSPTRTVINNTPPTISGSNGALGVFQEDAPMYSYTVADVDEHQVNVEERFDGVLFNSYTVTLGQSNTLSVPSDIWLKATNGSHTLVITAEDARGDCAVRTLSLSKAVTSVVFEQRDAMAAESMPTRTLVNIDGYFPVGSVLTVEICNNGNDDEPRWEDITQVAQAGQRHFFTNSNKTAAAWGVKVRATLLRGTATETCYIKSISGNFA